MEAIVGFFDNINVTEWYNVAISVGGSIDWFLSLGYVMIVSIILTLLVTALSKVTIFKSTLSKYNSVINNTLSSEIEIKDAKNKKDKLLSIFGYITSIVIYAGIYILFDCIESGMWSKEIFIKYATDKTFYSVTIPTGAATTLLVVKGLYTMIHKFIGRIKDKISAKEIVKETANDLANLKTNVVANQEAEANKIKTLTNSAVGQTVIKSVVTNKKKK